MAKIATRGKKLSDVLAFEEMPEHGVCRRVVTVTMEAGMDVGAVLQYDGTSKYTWVTAASVATLNADVVVLIETVKDVPNATAGDQQFVVLARGHAGVCNNGLLFKGTALNTSQKDTVYAALRAKNIHIRSQV